MAGGRRAQRASTGPGYVPVKLFVSLVCVSVFTCASASIMAVDLGTEFMKVALVQSGRTPISIVINEISKRKTPALVGFVGQDRLVGEEAAGLAVRNPGAFVSGLVDLLGRDAEDPRIQALARAGHLRVPLAAPTSVNRSSSSPALDFGEPTGAYTAEELVASLLEYAATISHEVSADGTKPRDIVIVASAALGPRQRQALADAAATARLNLLGLVSPGAAAALQYGIDRSMAIVHDGPQLVLFFDMGSGSTELTLTRFSSYEHRGSPACQVEILDVLTAPHGVQDLEAVLVSHFAQEAEGKILGPDTGALADHPRSLAKLHAGVKRMLRVLSANADAYLSVEELHDGKDFRSRLTRDEFEALAGPVWDRLANYPVTLLERNNLTSADLTAVELLGGGSRIPRVKAALSTALNGRTLDAHLDADEAVVLGAALFAANRSTQFRLRPFGLVDRVFYRVDYELDTPDAAAKPLIPARKRVPTKRAINLLKTIDSARSDDEGTDSAQNKVETLDELGIKLLGGQSVTTLEKNKAESTSLPAFLGQWRLHGLRAALGAHDNVTRVAFHIRCDDSGLLTVEGADMTVTRLVEQFTTNVTAKANATAVLNVTESTTPGNNETVAGEKKDETVVTHLVPRTSRIPLNITGSWAAPRMDISQLRASRAVMTRLAAREASKRAAAQAKNDLEGYIISAQSWSTSDEDVLATSTEAERETFAAALESAEDWLYGDGESAGETAYHAKMEELLKLGSPLRRRGFERAERPRALAEAKSQLEIVKPVIKAWPETKPWVPKKEVQAAEKQVADLEKWMGDVEAKQAKKTDLDKPAFTSAEVQQKLSQAIETVSRLQRKSPPPSAKKSSNDTEAKQEEGADKSEL